MLNWFDAADTVVIAKATADRFADAMSRACVRAGAKRSGSTPAALLSQALREASHGFRPQRMNLYQRARYAGTFKARLVDTGVPHELAESITRALIGQLALVGESPGEASDPILPVSPRDQAKAALELLRRGDKYRARGEFNHARRCYVQATQLNPRDADVLNDMGVALGDIGAEHEAEGCFRRAIAIKGDHAEAHGNLGAHLSWTGARDMAEESLRRAIRLKPDFVTARNNYGATLVLLGRLDQARRQYREVLAIDPDNAEALCGKGRIAMMEGRFTDAESLLRQAIAAHPGCIPALAALASVRKMLPADGDWLARAEEVLAAGVPVMQEVSLRFAMGKYLDDVGEYRRALECYRRGNELLKPAAARYDRSARERFVDAARANHTKDTLEAARSGASTSSVPVFVVGMPRSGTTLVEQIIAAHPDAVGAGELRFWSECAAERVRQGLVGVPGKVERAVRGRDYLRALRVRAGAATRVVDKAPINADHLGLIHCVLPRARIIHVVRNPIDTCLSCYFQQLSPSLNFSMDLADLAHYVREHQRLLAHWRDVLPTDILLEVRYEDLVSDPEPWARRIVEFVGLPWDGRCLEFQKNRRAVVTSSFWQVRQSIYRQSVDRWRHYAAFLGPLSDLG